MKMTCAYCGETREYPDDFPDRNYAQCRDCFYVGDKGKKMRKGWFKKARKKFVKKRVYRWKLCTESCKEEIEFLGGSGNYRLIGGWFAGSYTIKFCSHDKIYQILEKVKDLGFVQGFWYARKEAMKKEGFYFWFDNKI